VREEILARSSGVRSGFVAVEVTVVSYCL